MFVLVVVLYFSEIQKKRSYTEANMIALTHKYMTGHFPDMVQPPP